MNRWPLLVFALVVAAIPLIPGVPPFWIVLLDNIGLAALVAMGLVLLTGVGGLTSFGQAAFCGFVAYTTAVLTVTYGFSPWLTLPLSLVVSGIAAVILGIITVRLSGQIAFLLAAVIGAISGILIVPITTLYYDTGFLIGLKGFIAAIIGGLVSYPLTAVAALIVGTVEAFSSFYASNFKEVIVFTLILPVLVLRSLAAPAVEEEKD